MSSGKRGKTAESDASYDKEQCDRKMTLTVKVLRSRKLKRVLCLECDKEFADILLSLLIIPVGTILKHVEEGGLVTGDNNGMFNLYSSMKQLDVAAFTVDRNTQIDKAISGFYYNEFLRLRAVAKEKCLNPNCENETLSKGEVCDKCEEVTWYACSNLCMQRKDRPSIKCSRYHTFGGPCSAQAVVLKLQQCLDHFNTQSYGDDMKCPSCNMLVTYRTFVIKRKAVQTSPEQKTKSSSSGNGATGGLGFVEKNITFMVKEDLSIIKSSALSALALLQTMHSDFADLDTKEIDVGQKEGLLLVRAAMVSKTPLTDVFGPFFK